MEDENLRTGAGEEAVNSPPLTENPVFARGEMLPCAKCERLTPPTRNDCLYCGARLEISDAQRANLKPNLRPLEAWENGYNVIFTGIAENLDDARAEEIAASLRLDASVLRQITESKKPLPLARIETRLEAEIVGKKLFEAARIETKIVGDADLNGKNPPRRLRAMDFYDDKIVFILFSGDETVEIAWENLILIVTGAIFERRISGVEAFGKSGESKLLETNESASDALLIDVYSRDDSSGFRVEQQGFDFSCLGAEKKLLVAENLRSLVKKLSERAPAAKIVEDYLRIRHSLAAVWAVEERTDARGLTRERFAKFNRENVTTINNGAQFTKYSRLQRQLL